MKKIINEVGVFRREFMDSQSVSDEIQTRIYLRWASDFHWEMNVQKWKQRKNIMVG